MAPRAQRRSKPKARFVAQPPQFVMTASDNRTELDRWDDWSKFIKQNGKKARFTFFVSGTNFLAESKKTIYQGPYYQPGESEINFGGTVQDVKKRIDYVNALKRCALHPRSTAWNQSLSSADQDSRPQRK